jgi:hypothetical protein
MAHVSITHGVLIVLAKSLGFRNNTIGSDRLIMILQKRENEAAPFVGSDSGTSTSDMMRRELKLISSIRLSFFV